MPAYAAIAILGLLDVVVLATRVGPLDGVWSIDQGVRIEQIQSLVANRYRSLASVYPGESVDPKHAYTPLLGQYLYRDGKSYSMFSAAWAILSSVPFLLFSYPGLYVVPVASTLALLLLVENGTRKFLSSGARAVLILVLGLATPLFFYSIVFWDHTLVAMLALLAVGLGSGSPESSPGRLAGAGAVLGVAAWFRPEAVMAVPALALALLITDRPARFRPILVLGAGAAATLLPLLVFQRIVYGSLLGPHVLVALGQAVPSKENALFRIPDFHGWIARRESWASFLIAPPERSLRIAVVALVGLRVLSSLMSERARRTILVLSAATLVALGIALLSREPADLETTLLTTAPLTLLALLPPPRKRGATVETRSPRGVRPVLSPVKAASERTARLLGLFALFDIAFVFLTVAPDGGHQWGPRLLLPAVAPLVVAGFLRASEWTEASLPPLAAIGLLAGFALLTWAGISSERQALDRIRTRNRETSELAAAVGASGERVIVCSDTIVARFLAPLAGRGRLVFRAENASRLSGLEELLRQRGFERFLLIDFARFPVLAPSVDNPDFPRDGPPLPLPKGYQMTHLRIR